MTAADGVATRKHHLWITNGHQIIQAAGVHGIRNYRYSLSSNWVDSHWSPLSSWSIMMMIMMITIIIVKNMVWTCCAKPWILIITIGAVNGPITEVLQTFKRIFCILNQFSPELKCISSPLGIGRVQKLGTGCLFIITSFFFIRFASPITWCRGRGCMSGWDQAACSKIWINQHLIFEIFILANRLPNVNIYTYIYDKNFATFLRFNFFCCGIGQVGQIGHWQVYRKPHTEQRQSNNFLQCEEAKIVG